jgi:hypothetical protein
MISSIVVKSIKALTITEHTVMQNHNRNSKIIRHKSRKHTDLTMKNQSITSNIRYHSSIFSL